MTTLDLFHFGENFKQWIKIILGVEQGTNINAVTVSNGNIPKPLNIQQGCHQGDPMAGYLFIMAIEILELMLKNSKVRPYMTKKGPHIYLISMQTTSKFILKGDKIISNESKECAGSNENI